MTLAGANNFSENNDYTVYTVNSNQNGQYSLILPKNTDGEVSMIVDMNMKADFDALVSNTITKESLLEKLDKEYNKVKETNPYGILVFPMTDNTSLTSAINSNDKQKIFDETKKIGGITSELYKNLTDSGLDKSKINQKIMIIEKNEIDSKFVDWLKEQMPNFVDGMKYENEVKVETPVTENVAPQPEGPVPSDIFSEPAPTTAAPAQEPVTENAAPQPEVSVPSDIFSEPAPTTAVPAQEPVTENVIPQVEPVSAPTTEPQAEPISEPQPINSVSLDATQTIQPVENPVSENIPQQEVQQPTQPVGQVNTLDKKSGGFANILILLVILAVVTVGSIELGKFLFNAFGA